ncbi:MAG: toll/interleukin-1 receptor domain-containing protein [Firmicutes bacterium]|nr:toll/interleukin-1 receptor domain-containing protein [Bacillota bacterium]
MAGYIYDAFISYRHLQLDKAVAKKLHTLLETYHIPSDIAKICGKKKMGKVFRDEEELPLAVSLSENIEYALENSEWLIVICTPALLQSKWCMKEIDYFIEHGKRDRILCVLADGSPETSFPEQLTTVDTPDGPKSVEPLAANIVSSDIKDTLKKLGSEKLRILAPMLGVGYDDLRKRAKRRRMRIMAIAAAVVVVVGAAASFYVSAQNRKKAELLLETQRNQIGELLEKADASVSNNEKIAAASTLLEALEISRAAGGIRKDEILSGLRKSVYIEPFSVISMLGDKNIRILDALSVPDGKSIIGIVNNNSVARIDCITGEVVYQVSASNGQINMIDISPDGERFLAICDQAKSVTVWSVKDGSQVFTYTSKAGKEYQIANAFFLGDSDTLLIQDMDTLYKVRTDGTESRLYTIGDYRVSYDPYDNFLTHVLGKALEDVLTVDHDDYVGTCVAVSPDASKILVSGKDGSTGVVVISSSGQPLYEIEDMPGAFCDTYSFSPDGKHIVCTSLYSYFGSWNAETGASEYLYFLYDRVAISTFSNVAFSPDSSAMAFTADNYLYVLGTDASFKFGGGLDKTGVTPVLTFSADGRHLYVRSRDLIIIDTETALIAKSFQADLSGAFNNSLPVMGGDAVFVTRNNGTAFILSAPGLSSVSEGKQFDGKLAEASKAPADAFAGITLMSEHKLTDAFKTTYQYQNFAADLYFSPDGRYAVYSHADGFLEIFKKDDGGRVSCVFSEFQTRVNSVAFCKDMLAVSHESGKLMFCDLSKGTVIKVLGTDGYYTEMTFSPSGDHLMGIAYSRNQLDVFSVKDGLLFSMRTSETIDSFAFTEDGSKAVGITASGYVAGDLFTDEDALIKRAEKLAGR